MTFSKENTPIERNSSDDSGLRLPLFIHCCVPPIRPILAFLLLFSTTASATQECINVILAGTGGGFWRKVELGAVEAGRDLRVQVMARGTFNELNHQGQQLLLQAFKALSCRGLVVSPNAIDRAQDIDEIVEQGTTVIYVDRDAGGKRFGVVKSDDSHAGKIAAQAMFSELEKDKKVILFRAHPDIETTTQRENAFLSEARRLGLHVVEPFYLGIQVGNIRNTIYSNQGLISDFDGVFTPNETTTLGVLMEFQNLFPDKKYIHIGFDEHPKFEAALSNGRIKGLVVQDPFQMGYKSVAMALAAIRGEEVQKEILTPVRYHEGTKTSDKAQK